jgi:dTDP-4-dehydrorhamnose 3,5-epimerase
MKVHPCELPEVLIVEPDVYRDERGFFLEAYHQRKYAELGIVGPFVQDNHSFSRKSALRGLHAQVQRPQGKLVRAVAGEMFDVAVDIRPDSPTFKRWVGVRLSGDNFRQLYVPPGFAHGFCTLSDELHVEYKCTALYDPTDEIAIAWNDPDLAIAWPVTAPVVSEKDGRAPRLRAIAERLPRVDPAR